MNKNGPDKFFFKFLLFMFFFFLWITAFAIAAPYGPSDKNTVYDRLYESDLVIYGKILKKIKSAKGDLTEMEVYSNVKGGKWKKGDFFYVNSLIDKPEKTVGILFLYPVSGEGVEYFEVNAFYPDKDKEMYDYIIKIRDFQENGDDKSRLSWLYSKVNSKNDLISWDSFAQLGMASYEDLKKAAASIDRDSMRYLVSMPEVTDNRKSFFCFLLGLAGDRRDIALLKRILENPANESGEIVYGAMMGYGLLSKQRDNYYYKRISTAASVNIRLAVLEAVKNIMLYNRPSDPQPLLKSLYWALKHGDQKTLKSAVEVCSELQLTGPVTYMRDIYFNRFAGNKKGKIAVINYLKFVRKKTPDALKVLEVIRQREKDPEIRGRI